MAWIGPAIGAAGSLIGGAMGNSGAKAGNKRQIAANYNMQRRAMDFSAKSQKEAMGWNEEMSGSQMQRRVKDLIAAGLNPGLAYSLGGASAPTMSGQSGAGGSIGHLANEAAPMAAALGDLGGTVGKAVSAQQAMKMQAINVEQAKANVSLTNAQTASTGADAAVKSASVPFAGENAFNQSRTIERQAHIVESQVDAIMKDNEIKDLSIAQLKQLQPLLIEAQKLSNQASQYGMSEKISDSKFFDMAGSNNWFKMLESLRRILGK